MNASKTPRRRRFFLLSLLGFGSAGRAVNAAESPMAAPAQQGSLPAVLPYSGAATSSDYVLKVTNLLKGAKDGGASAIVGYGPTGVGGMTTLTAGGFGVRGIAVGSKSAGAFGSGEKGSHGVAGQSDTADGILGMGMNGVRGVSATANGNGVVGVFRSGAAGNAAANVDKDLWYVGKEQKDGTTRGYLGTEKQGVRGECDIDSGYGVAGSAGGNANTVAIYGQAVVKENFAGYFRGKVTVEGALVSDQIFGRSGLIAGPGKLFKIDHPLDPGGKYLMHASVESDERRNLYDGVVTLDHAGEAWVALPDWFEALNTDFRYQLTSIGRHAPVYVADEICGNRFRIAGGAPGQRISWMVTGVRQDALAKARPFVVEQIKPTSERGRYLYPEEHGKPETDGIHYSPVASI